MAAIRNAGSKTLTTGLGAFTSTFSAVSSAASMADDYITGAAASARVYRARAEADAAAKITLADKDAQDNAVAWIVERRMNLQQSLDTDEKRKMFNELKAEFFPK